MSEDDKRYHVIERVMALCDYHKAMSYNHRERVGILQQALEDNRWFPLLEDGTITSEEYSLLDPHSGNE